MEQKVLHEAAETEDGEEVPVGSEIGLHAKVYIYREWYRTHVVVGSANATFNGLSGTNVEFLAEVVGKDGKIGKPDSFLTGFGEMLVDYSADSALSVEEQDSLLSESRSLLLGVPVCLKCSREADDWVLVLEFAEPVCVPSEVLVKAWLITMPSEFAVTVDGIEPVRFVVDSPELITGFVAFSISSGKSVVQFTLNIPVIGMPEDRRVFILRSVIRRSEDFIRYLLMLLGEESSKSSSLVLAGDIAAWLRRSSSGNLMLLENIVSALASNPEQLLSVDQLVRELEGSSHSCSVFPEGFLEFWKVFREMIESEVSE
jgi:hypothetical protein